MSNSSELPYRKQGIRIAIRELGGEARADDIIRRAVKLNIQSEHDTRELLWRMVDDKDLIWTPERTIRERRKVKLTHDKPTSEPGYYGRTYSGRQMSTKEILDCIGYGDTLKDAHEIITEGIEHAPHMTPQEVLERAEKIKMTPDMKREQRISFAYGNTYISNPNITRKMVEEIADSLDLADKLIESNEKMRELNAKKNLIQEECYPPCTCGNCRKEP